MTDISQALAETDQPHSTLKAVHALVQDAIGVQLFTMTKIDQSNGVASRIYTTQARAYPVHGQKRIEPNNWTAKVLDRHETFVANSLEKIAVVFPDHALIQSLGHGSCINIPVVISGSVIGTLNCLHVADHYTPQRVSASEALKPLGAIAFLMHAFHTKDAGH